MTISGHEIEFSKSVRNLGGYLDETVHGHADKHIVSRSQLSLA